MSDDDLDIRHGGLVAVDTATLRAAADSSEWFGVTLSLSVGRIQQVETLLRDTATSVAAHSAATDAGYLVTLVRRLEEAVNTLALSLRQAASLYEASELHVAWLLAAAGDRDAIEAALRRALAGSSSSYLSVLPRELIFAALKAREMAWRHQAGAPLREDVTDSFHVLDLGGPPGPGSAIGSALATIFPGAIGLVGLHTVRAPLQGDPDRVRVWAIARREVKAPTSLAEVVGRIPGNQNGRVRLERYDFPDGTREWVIYIAGTEGVAGLEPWDVKSDLELYAGQASASSAAVDRALALAGRKPGEPLHIVGYSQGGIIAAHKAAADADVPTLITIATPVMAQMPPDVFTLDLRHGDDPVAGLSGQGPALGNGAPESLVVRRTVPDEEAYRQLMDAHVLDGYRETAEKFDASDDPRVEAARDVWKRLGGAASVTATNYGASRLTPVKAPSTPRPSPGPAPAPVTSGEKKTAGAAG